MSSVCKTILILFLEYQLCEIVETVLPNDEVEDVDGFSGKITMTITKITKGCSDNWFILDKNRYKNAVVVRR